MSEREHHIQVLEQFLHDYKEWGEDLELEKTIEYAISSLKTDLKYDLMYEGENIYTKADMVAMLEDLDLQIDESAAYNLEVAKVQRLIRNRINKLKEGKEWKKYL